jgi:hypothetical protein
VASATRAASAGLGSNACVSLSAATMLTTGIVSPTMCVVMSAKMLKLVTMLGSGAVPLVGLMLQLLRNMAPMMSPRRTKFIIFAF